jgi:hypothetical protein
MERIVSVVESEKSLVLMVSPVSHMVDTQSGFILVLGIVGVDVVEIRDEYAHSEFEFLLSGIGLPVFGKELNELSL